MRTLERPAPVLTPPPGERIPIDPRALPKRMPLEVGRRFDPGDWSYTVPQVLPVGGVVLFARPGAGKTRMAVQWEMCVAYGVPWAGYAPEDPGRVLVIDFENGMHVAINTSIDVAPFGEVAWDERDPAGVLIDYDTGYPGEDFAARFGELGDRLHEAAAAGQGYRLVRIDTLRAFIAPYPQGANTYQWEASCLMQLNNLAVELGLTIVIIHHTNKLGEISGSTGIEGSFTAAYKLEREAGGDEGSLRCTKNRVGPERHWGGLFASGVWQMSHEISAGQAASTGIQRAILDYLLDAGPGPLAEIRAGLPEVKPTVLKTSLSRLHAKGWVTRGMDGTWTLASGTGQPRPAAARRAAPAPRQPEPPRPCAVCGQPMDVLEPGQATHPTCDPEGKVRRHPAQPDPVPLPGLAGDQAEAEADSGEDQDPGPEVPRPRSPEACQVCGELRTVADQHPDCVAAEVSSARWPAVQAMKAALSQSRMHPIAWIPPAGDPRAKPGMQTRDLPGWQAAAAADVGAFHWTRPGLLEEFGPDALVITTDRNQSYVSSTSSVPLAPNVLAHTGPLEANPKGLGDRDQRTGKPTGLAGVVELIVPPWDHPELAHPLGRHAQPGQRMIVASGALEDLWRLADQGVIARPEVIDSWMGRRNTSLLEPFGKAVREARAQYAGDEAMSIAVKRSSSIAIRLLYPREVRSPFWRPDWYAALVSQAMFRLWVRAWQAVQAGAVVAGLGSVDETAFIVPAGTADPAGWLPEPYRYGPGWGEVKPKPITIRADRADLSGIDPAQIAESNRPGYVTISGPVPLAVWMVKRRA